MTRKLRPILAACLLLCAARAAEAQSSPPKSVLQEPVEREDLQIKGAFGQGLEFSTEDGNFGLRMRARIQTRATSLILDGESPRAEVEIRRARLVFSGFTLERTLFFFLQVSLAAKDIEEDAPAALRDGFVDWRPLRDLQFRVGQTKVPYNRHQMASSSRLQLADRSIINDELTLDRDIGVMVYSLDLFGLDRLFSYWVGLFGGEGRNRLNGDVGLLGLARIQFSPFGAFDDLNETDHAQREDAKLAIGLGVGFNHRTPRDRSTRGLFIIDERFDYLHTTADFIFKWRGLSVQAEFMSRQATQRYATETEPLPADTRARSFVGFFAQVAYSFWGPFELSARAATLDPIGDLRAPDLVARREFAGGLNIYIIGHALKFQADYTAVFTPQTQDLDHLVRAQLEAYF